MIINEHSREKKGGFMNGWFPMGGIKGGQKGGEPLCSVKREGVKKKKRQNSGATEKGVEGSGVIVPLIKKGLGGIFKG